MSVIRDEYFNATVQRLRDFRLLQAGLSAMQTERNNILQRMADIPSAIGRYGEKTASSRTLTGPEQYAEDSMTANSDLWALNRSIEEIEVAVNCLEYAYAVLTHEEKDLIRMRYFENKKWAVIEEEGNYCEKQSHRICTRAVWKIRNVIFAHRQAKPGVRYILLK